MTRGSATAPKTAASNPTSRTEESVAFEKFWFSLRNGDLVPARRDFSPAKAVHFLPNVILMEAPHGDSSGMRVRLVGSAIDGYAGARIAGIDYLEFLPAHLHEGALNSARLMFDQPCGLWQVMPVHYEAGIAQRAEITAFPLSPGMDGIPLIIVLVAPSGELVSPINTSGKAMRVEAATHYEYIDIGNGLPPD